MCAHAVGRGCAWLLRGRGPAGGFVRTLEEKLAWENEVSSGWRMRGRVRGRTSYSSLAMLTIDWRRAWLSGFEVDAIWWVGVGESIVAGADVDVEMEMEWNVQA